MIHVMTFCCEWRPVKSLFLIKLNHYASCKNTISWFSHFPWPVKYWPTFKFSNWLATRYFDWLTNGSTSYNDTEHCEPTSLFGTTGGGGSSGKGGGGDGGRSTSSQLNVRSTWNDFPPRNSGDRISGLRISALTVRTAAGFWSATVFLQPVMRRVIATQKWSYFWASVTSVIRHNLNWKRHCQTEEKWSATNCRYTNITPHAAACQNRPDQWWYSLAKCSAPPTGSPPSL